MWWLVSLIALVLLLMAVVVATFFLMVALNGLTSLPDAVAYIYLAVACSLIPALSLLAGLLAKKFSERNSLPLGLAGMLTTVATLVLVPILLCGLTYGLLLAFDLI